MNLASGLAGLGIAHPADFRGNLRYEEDLVEAAVFLHARGGYGVPALQIARFHRERERLYGILDADARQAAFVRLHREWFREWGLETRLLAPLGAFPLLGKALTVLAFRHAHRKPDEGAELYVNAAGARHGVVSLRSDAFAQTARLETFLRREYAHLHDMVDPAFGYTPDLPVRGLSAGQQRLARERYRLLWDITIDGRLTRGGVGPTTARLQRWTEFTRAFSFWPDARQQETFETLWTTPSPTHLALVALAGDPRGLRTRVGPHPGAACPLCEFPTFQWADPGTVDPRVRAAIVAEFPAWTPDQGVCSRCHEAYQVAISGRTQVPVLAIEPCAREQTA
jgi:hypothetical protein